MSGVLDRIVRDLQKAGKAREARGVELTKQLYGRMSLAELVTLLRAATEPDSPLARVKYLERLMASFDDATALLVEPPEGLAQAIRQSVTAGVKGVAEMFAAQQVAIDAFTVPPTMQLQWMDFNQERMAAFWRAEPPRFRQEVESALRIGLERGQGIDEMAARLKDRTGVSQSRAVFIARDQIGNAASFAMRQSQEEAGSTHYVWRSASDDRVRPEHAAQDGEVFAWDEPPPTGAPGEDYLCRCVALALPPGETE